MRDKNAVAVPSPRATPVTYIVCSRQTDRSSWNPKIARFFDYWLSIMPANGLPGRQHFDPLDIADIMPRIWMLDVLRDPLRYRYRFAGTKEVETLQREVTGLMFEDVHPHLRGVGEAFGRFDEIAVRGIATYRRGRIVAVHHKEHLEVENCMVPLARDGATVDIVFACSVLYGLDGREN
jgi:PAS domain-containing protein